MTIYCLTNSITGKQYIGQTTLPLEARLRSHRSYRGKRATYLHRSARKHGWDVFQVEVLEVCKTQEELDATEIKWIRDLKTLRPYGYNIRAGGLGGALHEQTKLKLRACRIGKKLSAEHRANISAGLMGRKPSAKMIELLIARNKARAKPKKAKLEHHYAHNNCNARLTWEQVDEIRARYKNGGISQEALAAEFGVNQTNIGFIIRGVTWPNNMRPSQL